VLILQEKQVLDENTQERRTRFEMEIRTQFVPRITIEYITDLEIQSPIRTNEEVAGGTFNQRIHHRSFTKRIDQTLHHVATIKERKSDAAEIKT